MLRTQLSVPICQLGLRIEGSCLEAPVAAFMEEVCGLGLIAPEVYLGMRWGTRTGTVAIQVPFWLADADLSALAHDSLGCSGGPGDAEVRRHLRHEYGHAVANAYRLVAMDAFVALFGDGANTRAVDPCSRSHCRYIPGNSGQHDRECDWAETFATRMDPTPGMLLRYAGWPAAQAKLAFAGQMIRALRHVTPSCAGVDRANPVETITQSCAEFFAAGTG